MLRFYHNQENFGALVLRRKWQHRQNVIGENLICIGSSFVDQSQLTQVQGPGTRLGSGDTSITNISRMFLIFA